VSTEGKSPPRGASAVLALAALAFALAQTAVIPAMRGMTQALHTSTQSVSWVLTGYLVSAAILTPVLGRLGDMFGKRLILVISLLLFSLGGALAAVAPNIWIVVAARVLQGAGGGIFPLCFGIISDSFPAERRPGALGLISAIAGVGAGGGLVLGGLLIDHASYHWIFWSGTVMAGLAILGVRTLPDSGERTPGRIDYVGTMLLGAGITAPLIALTETTSWGWGSARTLGLIGGGLVVLVLFGLFERWVKEPLVNMSVFARPTVLITNITTLLVGFALFGAFVLVPQIAETPKISGYGFGLGATGAGLLLVPGSLMMLAFGPLSGKLGLRFGAKVPLILGVLISAAGLGLEAAYHASEGAILGYSIVVFAGVGLAYAAGPNLIIGAVPRSMTGETTGVNALIRSLGSSVGSQVAATLLAVGVTAAHPLPAGSAFTKSFALGAGAAVVAGIAAFFIPGTSAKATGIAPAVDAELASVAAEDPWEPSELVRPGTDAAGRAGWPAAAWNGALAEPGLIGTVRDLGGQPVAGAVVTVTSAGGRQVERALAAPDGRYRITGLPPAALTVIVSAHGHEPAAAALMVPAGAVAERDFVLAGSGGLTGTVRSAGADAAPLAGAEVTVSDVAGNIVASIVTGGDGGFTVDGAPAGRYVLTATAPGHLPASRHIELDGHAETAQLTLPLEREVYGIVRSPDGEAVPGILVTATDTAGKIVANGTTDSYGRYRLTGLGDGEHVLVAGGHEPVSASVDVRSGDTASVTIRLGGRASNGPASTEPVGPAR
jgi:EmrB/QacA subfamily drug resistance transporter